MPTQERRRGKLAVGRMTRHGLYTCKCGRKFATAAWAWIHSLVHRAA